MEAHPVKTCPNPACGFGRDVTFEVDCPRCGTELSAEPAAAAVAVEGDGPDGPEEVGIIVPAWVLRKAEEVLAREAAEA